MNTRTAHVAAIHTSGTLLDFPGEVAMIIIYKGCNFKCKFCHNPDLLSSSFLHTPPLFDIDLILEEWGKSLGTGIVFSGGEPLMWPEAISLIKYIRAAYPAFRLKVDTNGSAPWALLDALTMLGPQDMIAMDVKTSPGEYAGLTDSLAWDNVKVCLGILEKANIRVLLRTTIIENIHTEEVFLEMLEEIPKTLTYKLQAFVPSDTILDTSFAAMKKTSLEYLEQLKNLAHRHGYKNVTV